MKKHKFIKKLILLMTVIVFMPSVYGADLTIDYLKNQAFESRYNKNPEVREVTLFSHKSKETKKNSSKIEVQYIDENANPDDVSLTDSEYIKKFKRANNNKIRKNQIDITVQRPVEQQEKDIRIQDIPKNNLMETSDENEQNVSCTINKSPLPEEKNRLMGDFSTTEEDDSAKTFDPSNKKFFDNAKKEKAKQDKKVSKEKKSFFKRKKDKAGTKPVSAPSNFILTADVTDYYPDRNEIEAIGNAKLEMTGQNFELYGDKIIFNHDTNTARAYDNVKIIQEDYITTGDFVNIDLNTSHSWIQKPVSSNYSIRIKSEEAYVFPDKIEEYDGVANIIEDKRFLIGSSSFATILNSRNIDLGDAYLKRPEPTGLKFKVKNIDVVSKEGHNVITMKNIGVYYKKFKVGVLPTLEVVSDKEKSVMQANVPEIGSDGNMGMYAGPSYVFTLPYSSTLKVAPLIVYSQDEKKLGFGASAIFMNNSNMTEMGYGSAEDKFMLRGFQSITPKLKLNYTQNMYASQWFLGYRKPMYSVELEYGDNFFVKDLGLNFEHRLSGGVYSEYGRIRKMSEGRLRWMTQMQKNFFTFTNCANTFYLDLGLIGQSSVSQYTTGDTLGIVRGGPTLTTTYRGWSQSLVYFQSGVSGRTPFAFDDYYYGRSNLQLIETLRINKYLSIGYLASMALGGKETYYAGRFNPATEDFLQENMFLISLGPEEAKLTLSYDAIRKSTALYFSMLLGSRDMDIKYKKTTIYDPDKLGGDNKKFPYFRQAFDKVRYKVFPLTDPNFDRNNLYPQEVPEEEVVDDEIDETEEQEMQQQMRNQLNPILQNVDQLKDERM